MQYTQGTLTTVDGVKIAYEHRRRGFGSLVVICPGFFNSKGNRWMQRTQELISARHDTFLFDFRGHGDSGGTFTWLAKEPYDVAAVLDYVKEQGYRSIGILGYSLGAAAAVNTVSRASGVSRMMLISCPYSFWKIDYHFWKPEMLSDLKDNIDVKWEGKGVRPGSMFFRKRKPIREVRRIKHIPLFFIHGTRDWVIKHTHSQKLYASASGEKRIKLIEGGLHAERLVAQDEAKMSTLFVEWFAPLDAEKNQVQPRRLNSRQGEGV
ncbi:MAG: alpha/beta fold hydrolase [Candidatus Omnitrophica bacterium]|nr:alpha/beta fold hydrolase [Candidatus Omnitrophota bacterium]